MLYMVDNSVQMKIINGIVCEMSVDEITEIKELQAIIEATERTRPLTESEVSRLIIAQQINNLTVDDATASRMVEFYPTLKQDGSLIKANSRINWNGTLKRAAVDLWDTEENNPDKAPELWEDIEYRNGIRVIPSAIPATDPFKLGDYGWWGNDLYQSAYEGDNVWTPEGYPAAWTKINL